MMMMALPLPPSPPERTLIAVSTAVGDHRARLHSNSTGESNTSGGLVETRPMTCGAGRDRGRAKSVKKGVNLGADLGVEGDCCTYS